MSAKQQHHDNAAEHGKASKEEAEEALRNMKDSGADAGIYAKEKILEGVEAGKEGGNAIYDSLSKAKEYLGAQAGKASATAKANVVTATSFLKTQVEEAQNGAQEAYQNVNSAAGEFADQAAETAKAGVSKAEELLKASKDKLLNDKKNPFLETASKVKDHGEEIKAKIGSYISESTDSLRDQFQLGNDMSRAWKRFKSKLYTLDRSVPPERNDRDFIQDFVNRYFKGKTIQQDPNELVASIYDTLQGSKDKAMDKIQDGAKFAKDKASETYNSATRTIDDYRGIDYSAFTDALNEVYESASNSPRAVWKSVYYKLSDSNHPLADSVSKLASSPIPITSFYLSLFSFFMCYSILFNRRILCSISRPKTQEVSNSSTQLPQTTYSFYAYAADNFSWAPMAFINILVLEFNGYSSLVIHSIAFSILLLEGFSRYCPEANQFQCKSALMFIVMFSSVLNFFTALTGFPVIG